MKRIISFLVVLTLVAAGCSNVQKKEPEGVVASSTDAGKIILSTTKVYPGSSLDVYIKYNIALQSISMGFDNSIKLSPSMPEDSIWQDTITVPNLQPGDHDLIVVANPADNSLPTTFTAKIQVFKKPAYSLKFDTKQKGIQKIVVSGTEISKVTLLHANKISENLSKSQEGFSINAKVEPSDKLIVTDKNGIDSYNSLFGDYADIYMYYLKHHKVSETYDPATNNITIVSYDTLCKKNIHSDVEEELEKIEFPDTDDELLASYIPKSKLNTNPKFDAIKLITLSPDARFCIFTTRKLMNINQEFIENGRRLKSFISYYTFLYDRHKKLYVPINKYCHISYIPKPSDGRIVFREVGTYLFPVYWNKTGLVFVESKKDENIVKSPDIKKYPRLTYYDFSQSPIATARYATINTDTYKKERHYALDKPLKKYIS